MGRQVCVLDPAGCDVMCIGPMAHKAGHDINYLALSGVLSVS